MTLCDRMEQVIDWTQEGDLEDALALASAVCATVGLLHGKTVAIRFCEAVLHATEQIEVPRPEQIASTQVH